MNHTPGPWEINFGIRPPRIYSSRSTETTIVDLPHWSPEHWEERTANANLIAAAPELLEACKTVFNATNTGGCIGKGEYKLMIEKVESAIRKAKGE